MEKIYNHILQTIRKNNTIETYTIYLCKVLPYITAISYIGIIIYALLFAFHLVLYIVCMPVSIFVFVTILRKIWNRSRPYETLNIKPLFKNKTGESSPSRHTASAFAIALAGYLVNPSIGWLLIIVALLIGISRFIAGVHYIFDILLAIGIVFIVYWLVLTIFPI